MGKPGNAYIQLLRPHQYVKNLFIFLPQFFGLQITNTSLLGRTTLAFIAFSLMASAVYVFNDYHDRDEDRNHPEKRNRPLASGKVRPITALLLAASLLVVSGAMFVELGAEALTVAGVYLVVNVAYTLLLKHIPIIDAFSVAVGFLLRLSVGSAVTAIVLSKWIVLMTFLLALFLAFAKRRSDVLIYLESGNKTRKLVDGYSLQLLDAFMMIVASVVIVAYIMYTVSAEVVARAGTEKLYMTVAFVILGIMRYLQISIVQGGGGSPTRVFLQDRFIQLTVLGWVLANVTILYLIF